MCQVPGAGKKKQHVCVCGGVINSGTAVSDRVAGRPLGHTDQKEGRESVCAWLGGSHSYWVNSVPPKFIFTQNL